MKKVLLLTFAFLMFSNVSNAQIKKPSNNNQSIVEQAVKDGIIIINQSYNLKNDENKYFGRNDDSDFGNSISLGLLYNGDVILNDMAMNPQNYDSLYLTKYKNKYDAVNSETKYRTLNDKKYKTLKIQKSQLKTLEKGCLYQYTGSDFNDKGFVIDDKDGIKDGWLVWVMANINDDVDDIKIVPVRAEFDFDQENTLYEVKQIETDKTILGGFFVKQVVSGVGKITFKLAGVLVSEGDKWSVLAMASISDKLETRVPAVKEEEVLESEETGETLETPEDGLIQISGSKKRRK